MNEQSSVDTVSHTGKPVQPIEVISASWKLVGGSKGTYFAALAIIFAITLAIALLQLLMLGSDEEATTGLLASAFGLIQSVISWVLGAGVIFIALRRVRGEEIRASMIFECFEKVGPIILAYVMMGLLVTFGFILLILPGLYLVVSYIFVIPLIIDKGLAPWDAMETSRKVVTSQWFNYFIVMLILCIIGFIAVLPLGVGLIWAIPLGYNTIGNLYVEAFDAA